MSAPVPPAALLARVHSRGLRAIELSEQARCQVDGVMLARHERCRGCGVLMGPGHLEAHSESGFCSVCGRDLGVVVSRPAVGRC